MEKWCVYCGDWYDLCRDHIVPISYCQVYRDYKRNATVPACRECNNYLSNKAYHTVLERAIFLLSRYPRKYRRLLRIPIWTPEECAELGYFLRVGIESKMNLREVYDAKIANLERVSNGYDSILIGSDVTNVPPMVLQIYICENCDEEFNASKPRRFCSAECRIDKSTTLTMQKRKSSEIPCTKCGAIFLTTRPMDALYCAGCRVLVNRSSQTRIRETQAIK